MDWDDRVGLDNNASFLSWIRKYDDARENRLTNWVSTFHPDRLPCELTTDKRNDNIGAYNLSCKVEFKNGEKWTVRFPMVGKVVNAEEKTEIEVATMKLIRRQTTIPVPEVKAWGLAKDNALGIGPFIMMDFVEGISVDQILQNDARIMRQDIPERTIEAIFRQMIDFSLQLQKLDFQHIGSLTSKSSAGEAGFTATVHSRPFTKKSHDFLLDSGVDVFSPQDEIFTSTTEYFRYVVDRDLKQLHDQPNSVDDERDAREKYIYFNVMKDLIPRLVLPKYNLGPFKLFCDDFQPTNMIVNNEQDLEVVAVIDLEWSYTAPIQLVNSTPTWLVIESPNVWSSVDGRLARFQKHLELYSRILKEEENKILGDDVAEDQKPSAMLHACQKDGRQWFHFIILRGFNGPTCVPFVKLREETKDWDELVAAIPEDNIDSFVQKKMADLQEYKEQLVEVKERYEVALKGGLEDLDNFLCKNKEMLSLGVLVEYWLNCLLVFFICWDQIWEALPHMGTQLMQIIDKCYDNSLENIGEPDSFVWYGPFWAQASTDPSRLVKAFATQGGIRVPFIICYPPFHGEEATRPGSIIHQPATVMDIAPTVLDLTGIKHPTNNGAETGGFCGREVVPMKGKSWRGLFEKGETCHDENEELGWELHGRAGMRIGHWKINFVPPPFGPGEWELHNLQTDPGEVFDLKDKEPGKFKELSAAWDRHLVANGVVWGAPMPAATIEVGESDGDVIDSARGWMK